MVAFAALKVAGDDLLEGAGRQGPSQPSTKDLAVSLLIGL